MKKTLSMYVHLKIEQGQLWNTTITHKEAGLYLRSDSDFGQIMRFFDDLNGITKALRKAVKQNSFVTITFGRYVSETTEEGYSKLTEERCATGSKYAQEIAEEGGLYLYDEQHRTEADFWLDMNSTLAEQFKAFDDRYYYTTEGRLLP